MPTLLSDICDHNSSKADDAAQEAFDQLKDHDQLTIKFVQRILNHAIHRLRLPGNWNLIAYGLEGHERHIQ